MVFLIYIKIKATNLDTLSPLVNELIKIVNDYQDEEIVSCACGILSNLTCNNILNKQTICLSNGIKVLGMALSRYQIHLYFIY
jgi:hypothetical protein